MPAGLIFPLDFSEIDRALKYVKLLCGHVDVFKIGLELFVHTGPIVIKKVREAGARSIFLDLKFHDIPETVQRAIKGMDIESVEFITVHSGDGPDIMKAAVRSVPSRVKILGVTLLTSLSSSEIHNILLLQKDVTSGDLVLHRANMAKMAGCAGVICSGEEISLIREKLGRDFLVIVPGIRPVWSPVRRDDQRRVVTPREAVLRGADYIVVGRPIRDASDPLEAADKILSEIQEAHKE